MSMLGAVVWIFLLALVIDTIEASLRPNTRTHLIMQKHPLDQVVCAYGIYALWDRPVWVLLWVLLYKYTVGIQPVLLVLFLIVHLTSYVGPLRIVIALTTLLCTGILIWLSRKVIALHNTRRQSYTKLDFERREIRLLTLFPGNEQETPTCVLEVFKIDDHPPYEALSHSWHMPDGSKPVPLASILVNNRYFVISKGLYVALTHLRYPRMKRTLWIDTLCIDQGNIQERSEQVQLMRFIYSLASRVIIWLGEGDSGTDQAMQLIRACHEVGEWRVEDDVPDSALQRARIYSGAIPHLVRVFNRPWWGRIWIVQELAMAQAEPLVYLGHERVPWSALPKMYLQLAREYTLNFERCPPSFEEIMKSNVLVLDEIRQKQLLGHKEESLVWHLRSTWKSRSSDLKDKIYALLGLARQRDRHSLVPDYRSSVSYVNIYAKVVKHFIEIDGSLSILSFYQNRTDKDMNQEKQFPGIFQDVENEQTQRYGLAITSPNQHPTDESAKLNWPTWIPQFHIGLMDRDNPAPFITANETYIASGAVKANAQVSDDLKELSAKGIFFDFVDDWFYPEPQTPLISYLLRLKQLTAVAMNSSIKRSDTRYALDRSESYWRLPVADRSPPKSQSYCDYKSAEDNQSPAPQKFKTMYDVLINGSPVPHEFVPPTRHPLNRNETRSQEYTKPYREACIISTFARSAFTTRCGFVGLGPPDIRKDDSVVILFGADVPFILRRQRGWYTLIRDCYVHGIMQGELINLLSRNQWKPDGPSLEEFNIR